MKLLVDENLPKRLKLDFPEHEIYTVSDKGWNSKTNGELLKQMLIEKFEVLFTFDKNIQYQQNFEKYPVSVLILIAEDNSYPTLKPLISKTKEILNNNLKNGPTKVTV
jgi:predicted nuclease of predicted toxin-antitoxin system